MLDLRKLNLEQREAVVYNKGPLLVIAGPGTGKTTVIVSRVVYLIKKGVKPEEILGLTFSEKVAQEMEERVESMVSFGYSESWISTFHSFCDRVLKENGLDIGISDNYKIIEDTTAWLLVKRNFDRFNLDYYKPLSTPNRFISILINHFSKLKDESISPEDYLKTASKMKGEEKKRTKEVAGAYKTYQEILLENNCLDFGDLINYTLQLFQKRPHILQRYKEQFKHILIDEFQDTNYAQYELIKLLASNNIMVCADSNQAIYKWRGASFGNISRFRKDYPKTKNVVLVKSYRSFQNILDISHKFISFSRTSDLKYLKKLIAHRKGKGKIDHLHFKTSENELNGVIEKIIELKKEKKVDFSDFAILTRSNNEANMMAKACQRAKIPYNFMALRGLYQKPIVLDIIAYFNLLDNYHESSAVYRVLNFPFWEIKADEIAEITRYSYQKTQSLYKTIKEIHSVLNVSSKTKNKIKKIVDLIEAHSKIAPRKNISEVFISFLKDSGYLDYLAKKGAIEDVGYINQFYDRIRRFEESNLDSKLKNFMDEFNLELESGESGKFKLQSDYQEDAVKIMTVHAAKGLEFSYVFIINLVDRKFPTSERRDVIKIPQEAKKDTLLNEDHIKEESNLFYVAITRAKDGLFFTSADDYGGFREKKLSKFLIGLGYSDGLKVKFENKILLKNDSVGKKQKFLPKHFSFTQLAAFSKCPLQYKFAHVLKIPLRERPIFVFGKSIHNTLYDFVNLSLQKKVDLNYFLKIYNENWIDEWYENKKQKKQYYQLGKKIIKSFYSDFIKSKPEILFFDKNPALEKNFNLNIKGEIIKGKIDRIDEIEGGIEIIDYKTGLSKKTLKKEEKNQLLIYQIVAEEIFGLNPTKLTYYYLNEGKTLSFLGNEKDKEKLKEEIGTSIEEIKKSNFNATPGWDCRYCDFKNICEHRK